MNRVRICRVFFFFDGVGFNFIDEGVLRMFEGSGIVRFMKDLESFLWLFRIGGSRFGVVRLVRKLLLVFIGEMIEVKLR